MMKDSVRCYVVEKSVPQRQTAEAFLSVSVAHPLLEQLREVDKEIGQRFQNGRGPASLGDLGLIMDKVLDGSRYSSTPINCRTFASTGGDGVHFSLLLRDRLVDEKSPVVMTEPAMGLDLIVGETLFDFLCLGSRRGYFALEGLIYKPEVTLEAYTNPDWHPTEKQHDSAGLTVDEHKRLLLDYLTERLKLRPWTEARRLSELQDRFGSLLDTPP